MDVTLSLLLVLVGSVLAFLARWVVFRREKLGLFKRLGIPGPQPNLLKGNLSELGTAPNKAITKWLKEFGDVFGYYVGEVPFVVIKDLDMLKQVFQKDFQVFMNRPASPFNVSGNNPHLAHLEGRRWKEVRSILSPTFSSGKIKLLMEIVSRKVDISVEVVRKKAVTGEMFDMEKTIQALTLDTIADCAFAMKTDCQNHSDDKLLIAVHDAFHYKNNPALTLSIMFPFLTQLLLFVHQNLLTTGRMLSIVVDHLKVVVDARKKNPEKKCIDFLHLVMEANQNESKIRMTDQDIISNAVLFLLAGYETTSTAMTFTFYLLVTNQHVQEKLYQEVANAKDCSYDTVQSLQYLDQVFSESLRLYPPVTGFQTRFCSQDHQVGSITIPKGANVYAPVWDIHHDPHLWPDPWKFDPDRFSPEKTATRNSLAFLSFGAGPRNCIGSRFALLEAKLTLFKLIKEFRFEACEKTEDPLTLFSHTIFNISPTKGVYLKAVPRVFPM